MTSKRVNIPRHLKQRMSEHREINWTEVMRNAAYEHLDKIEKKPEVQVETAFVENKGALTNLFANMNSRTKLYLVAGLGIFILLIALWQYLWVIGIIGILYLVYKRRQKA